MTTIIIWHKLQRSKGHYRGWSHILVYGTHNAGRFIRYIYTACKSVIAQ